MKRLFRALEEQLSAGKKRLGEARERLEQRIVDEAKDRLVEQAKERLAAEASSAKDRLANALFGDEDPSADERDQKKVATEDPRQAERRAREQREAERRAEEQREAERAARAREAAKAEARQKAEIEDELAALKRKLGK